MPDEANFCLNCGENIAKYRASSGFVKEAPSNGGAHGAPGAPATAGSAQRSGPPPHGLDVEIEIGGSGRTAAQTPVQSRAHRALLADARMAADTGNLQAAADTFRRAVELDPDSADAWYGLGVVYGRLGRQLEALAAFNQLLDLHPRLAAAWDAKGTALAALGRLGEAVAAYDEALRLDPGITTALIEKGIAFDRMGDPKSALECFEAVTQQDAANAGAWLQVAAMTAKLGNSEKALRSVDRALEISPANPLAWRRKGEMLMQLGHPSDARRCFDRAIQLDANDFESLVRRGDAMRAAGDPTGAIDSYERAVAVRPERAEPHVRKGLLFFAMAKYPAARDCFSHARKLEPDHQMAAVNYAVSLYRCREFEGAKAAAEEALLRWPGQAELVRVLSASERKLRPLASSARSSVQPPGADHTVEDIFLIYRDGRLVAHHTRRLRADVDNQLLSGMLTAIQSFIREAFREGEEGELNEMAFGRNQILIERGRCVSIAVVIHGVPPVGARAELRFALENIERTHGKLLESWDGEAQKLRSVGDLVGRLLEVL
jgi:tetratricopeptide (TPR) repeat protein